MFRDDDLHIVLVDMHKYDCMRMMISSDFRGGGNGPDQSSGSGLRSVFCEEKKNGRKKKKIRIST
jgi:hypothetical protein